jgi:NADH-quinone oxidoreductase subunit K
MIGLEHYLTVSALLFGLGGYCMLTRKNAIGILMGVELVLNSANVNLIAFSHFGSGTLDGHIFAIFVILLAAAEAAIGLAIILAIYQNFQTIDVEAAGSLKE